MRLIALVDMDYFFAACEELRRPEIKGKPVVVGADPKGGNGRGVVSTCNYPARKFGIRSGMPISMAYRLNKNAIFLPVDWEYYEKLSKQVMAVAKEYADKFEQVSVDEAYLDLSKRANSYEEALTIADRLKEDIKSQTGLPCSIGVGTNKLISKMACEAAKPGGVKVIKEEDAKAFLSKKPIGDLYGVGRKMKDKLEGLGYKTIGDLAKANLASLVGRFGVYGAELYNYANGRDDSEVEENYEIKSIGRERTFEKDTTDRAEIVKMIKNISAEVAAEVKKSGFAYKTVTIKIRYENFEEHLKSKSLSHLSDDQNEMSTNAIILFDMCAEKDAKIRKIGVRASNLRKYKGQKKISEY